MKRESTAAVLSFVLALGVALFGCGPATLCTVDLDGDGALSMASCPTGKDCDDVDALIRPGAVEVCDGIDNNCDGYIDDLLVDVDGDGYYDDACPSGTDCDDADASINPQAEEVCGDGLDNDCSGVVDDRDRDGDGEISEDCAGGTDCDDLDDSVYLGQIEDCDDGVDNDCDGSVDADDADGDGHIVESCGGDDCDDLNEQISPSFPERCDGIDHDCDGATDDVDKDEDGYFDEACGGDDCDDRDAAISPAAVDDCTDGIDNNCDGVVDVQDYDGDGDEPLSCGGTDCDDGDPGRSGLFEESCGDGLDNDCDGVADNRDIDADGSVDEACGGDDCDDENENQRPGLVEHCDDVDADCDGDLDDVDRDRDGAAPLECGGNDCDDGLARVRGGLADLCDGLDNDCDGFGDSCSCALPGAEDWGAGTSSNWVYIGPWSIEDEALLFTGMGSDATFNAVYAGQSFAAPFRASVDITRFEGETSADAGLFFGDSSEGFFVAIAEILGTPVYNVGYRSGGVDYTLTGHDPAASLVVGMPLPNKIEILHDGTTLTVWLNHTEVGTWALGQYTGGELALWVEDSSMGKGTVVTFDSLVVE